MKTNLDLCKMAQKAFDENWGYCLGGFGTKLTETLLKSKCSQSGGVGEYNTKHAQYLRTFMGKRVSDCIGMIKACVWWDSILDGPKYNSKTDRGTRGLLNTVSVSNKGPISTIPNIPGIAVWMDGHIGVYMGDNVIIECAGAPSGMLRSTKVNGVWKGGSKFTHWLKYPDIEYVEETFNTKPVEEEEEMAVVRYATVAEMPIWAKDAIQHLVDKKYISKPDNNNLNLSEDMLRVFVVNYRAGLYK